MLTALLLSLLATAPTPQAGEPEPDGVVATAPATPVALDGGPAAPVIGGAPQAAAPHGLDTDEQIARWLAARSEIGRASCRERVYIQVLGLSLLKKTSAQQ